MRKKRKEVEKDFKPGESVQDFSVCSLLMLTACLLCLAWRGMAWDADDMMKMMTIILVYVCCGI